MAILHLRPSSRARLNHRSPSLFSSVCFLGFLSLLGMLVIKVHDFAYQTRTVAGHNLKPTPWHPFEPKVFDEGTGYSQATKILQCQYLQCLSNPKPYTPPLNLSKVSYCPAFFKWIHKDLKPWSKSRIGVSHLEETKPYAAFRVTIVGGRLYVDLYYDCVQSRMMFTVWGLLQLLKRYPGMIPDVDMMFDCMDRPRINRTEHISRPLPLFRYCTTAGHFDIPFPDWSFWGWYESKQPFAKICLCYFFFHLVDIICSCEHLTAWIRNVKPFIQIEMDAFNLFWWGLTELLLQIGFECWSSY